MYSCLNFTHASTSLFTLTSDTVLVSDIYKLYDEYFCGTLWFLTVSHALVTWHPFTSCENHILSCTRLTCVSLEHAHSTPDGHFSLVLPIRTLSASNSLVNDRFALLHRSTYCNFYNDTQTCIRWLLQIWHKLKLLFLSIFCGSL